MSHEIFGINADMRETCAKPAAQGFIALCPDLFWRQEPGVELPQLHDWDHALHLCMAFDRDKGVAYIAATVQAARTLPSASG